MPLDMVSDPRKQVSFDFYGLQVVSLEHLHHDGSLSLCDCTAQDTIGSSLLRGTCKATTSCILHVAVSPALPLRTVYYEHFLA